MGLSDKRYVVLFQVSEWSAGRHSRNLELAIGYYNCGLAVNTAGYNC